MGSKQGEQQPQGQRGRAWAVTGTDAASGAGGSCTGGSGGSEAASGAPPDPQPRGGGCHVPGSGRAGRRLSCCSCSKTNPRQRRRTENHAAVLTRQDIAPPSLSDMEISNEPGGRLRGRAVPLLCADPRRGERADRTRAKNKSTSGLCSAGSWIKMPQKPLLKHAGRGQTSPGRRMETRIPSPCCKALQHGEGQARGHGPTLPAGTAAPAQEPPRRSHLRVAMPGCS